MRKYIEFTTSAENIHVRKTFGSPIHFGSVPKARKEVDAVRIDGKPVEFIDDTIPSRLHRSLINGQAIEGTGAIFDCFVFAALMGDVSIGQPNKDGMFCISESELDERVDPDDTNVTLPLNLIRYTDRVTSGVMKVHTVVPAHYDNSARYLHKLGDSGPICLSGLTQALDTFRCSEARPLIW